MAAVTENEPVSRFWTKIGMMADISRILSGSPAGNETLAQALKLIADIVPLDSAAIYLLDKKKDRLGQVASHGRAVNLLDFVRFDKGNGLSGWVAAHKRPTVIPGRDPELDGVREHHDSVMVLPLTALDELIGVLCCSHHERNAFDVSRQKLLEIVADQIAVSLERILYQKELESKSRMLRDAQTELEKTQAQLVAQETLKAVGELAVSVNHEINNPLAAIIGNAQIIELEAAGLPDKVSRRVQAIVDGARRISLITHNLLKIDRLVTESYLPESKQSMLNIHKSAGEHV